MCAGALGFFLSLFSSTSSHRENLEGMWRACDAFFEMSPEEKRLAGGEARRIDEVVGGMVGYQDHGQQQGSKGREGDSHKRFAGGNEHIDTRVCGPDRSLVPDLDGGAVHDELDAGKLIIQGRDTLHAVAQAVVGATALASGMHPGAMQEMMCDGSDLEEGKLSPSELRFLRYPNEGAGRERVAFEAHVVSRYITYQGFVSIIRDKPLHNIIRDTYPSSFEWMDGWMDVVASCAKCALLTYRVQLPVRHPCRTHP